MLQSVAKYIHMYIFKFLMKRIYLVSDPASCQRAWKTPGLAEWQECLCAVNKMTLGGTLEGDWRWSPVKYKKLHKALPPGKADDCTNHAKEVLMIKTLDLKTQGSVLVGEATDGRGAWHTPAQGEKAWTTLSLRQTPS